MFTTKVHLYSLYIIILLFASSCAPKVNVKTVTNTLPLNKIATSPIDSAIEIMYAGEPIPVTALELGQVHITDNGFSVNCDLLSVMAIAKGRASELGGNILYINNIKLPDFHSTCHRIEATVYKVDSIRAAPPIQEIEKKVVAETDKIMTYFETQPEFPGGLDGLNFYMRKNFSYPESALKDKTSGIVVIQFVIDKTGKTTDVEVIKSVRPDLDNEAMRLISMFPEWKPGFQNNKTVNVRYTLPITFTSPSSIFKKKKL